MQAISRPAAPVDQKSNLYVAAEKGKMRHRDVLELHRKSCLERCKNKVAHALAVPSMGAIKLLVLKIAKIAVFILCCVLLALIPAPATLIAVGAVAFFGVLHAAADAAIRPVLKRVIVFSKTN